MPPKPFSLPYRIGTDIASVKRQQTLLLKFLSADLHAWETQAQDGRSPNVRWTRFKRYLGKIFNRREWPEVSARTELILSLTGRKALAGTDDNLEEETRLAASTLASWLAGRWAAKEAAIKAHPARTLFMRQISILKPDDPNISAVQSDAQAAKGRPMMLIDPPTPRILMSAKVASERGIPPIVYKSHTDFTSIVRSGRVDLDQCQTADVSISHDGGYAIATVLAAHDDSQYGRQLPDVTDDGSSPIPLHEPEYSDKGFKERTRHIPKSIDAGDGFSNYRWSAEVLGRLPKSSKIKFIPGDSTLSSDHSTKPKTFRIRYINAY